ncbi:hypothetical protein ACJX0J_025560, partial [Zea mays]
MIEWFAQKGKKIKRAFFINQVVTQYKKIKSKVLLVHDIILVEGAQSNSLQSLFLPLEPSPYHNQYVHKGHKQQNYYVKKPQKRCGKPNMNKLRNILGASFITNGYGFLGLHLYDEGGTCRLLTLLTPKTLSHASCCAVATIEERHEELFGITSTLIDMGHHMDL